MVAGRRHDDAGKRLKKLSANLKNFIRITHRRRALRR